MATQPLHSDVPKMPPQSIVTVDAIPQSSLALQRAPEVVLEEAAKAASALKDVIERKPNKVVINGKTFLTFEDWQTLGRFYGITAAARTTEYLEQGRVRGYECHAEAILVSTGQVIGAAQAMCMDDEPKWQDKPLFQLRSMAQTRAQAKALRGVLAWVAVLAGYAPTPAEEMDAKAVANSLAPRMASNPIPRPRLDALCSEIRKAININHLKALYFAAAREAKAANDRIAWNEFEQAKDARKRELQ